MQKRKGETSWLIQKILGLRWKSGFKQHKISNPPFQSGIKVPWRNLQLRGDLSFLHLVTLCVTRTVILCGFQSTFWLQHYIDCFSLTMYFSRQPKARRWSHLPKNIESANFKNRKLNSGGQEVSIHCSWAHTWRDASVHRPSHQVDSQDPFQKSAVICLGPLCS